MYEPSPDVLTTLPAFQWAFFVGVALHLTVFRHGEWDLHTPHLLALTAVIDCIAAFALSRLPGRDLATILRSLWTSSTLLAVCVGGIFSSMLIYRASFHRLNRFPGPFLARLSNFYVTSLSVKKFHLFEEIQELHGKYGDIVRVGTL